MQKPILLFLSAALVGLPAAGALNDAELAAIERALPEAAPANPTKPRRLLIFTLNVGYGGHPSIEHASTAFQRMGERTGAFAVEVSNDPAVFAPAALRRFDAVLFNNTVGNCFTNADLRQSLLEFVAAGGGLMGMHGTSVAFTRWPGAIEDWPEFGRMLGARGAAHKESDEPVFLRVEDPNHPLTRDLPPQGFEYRDEYFRFNEVYSRDRLRVLLSIDTTRTKAASDKSFGKVARSDNDYAVAWIRTQGKGRVFYSSIAHNPRVFSDPMMLKFYLRALQFVLGDLPVDTAPIPQAEAEKAAAGKGPP
jgi:type 1 glutamine amidotransferase